MPAFRDNASRVETVGWKHRKASTGFATKRVGWKERKKENRKASDSAEFRDDMSVVERKGFGHAINRDAIVSRQHERGGKFTTRK